MNSEQIYTAADEAHADAHFIVGWLLCSISRAELEELLEGLVASGRDAGASWVREALRSRS